MINEITIKGNNRINSKITTLDENVKNDIIKILSSTDDENVKKIINIVIENCDIRTSREFKNKMKKYVETNRTLTDDQFNALYLLDNNRKVGIIQSDLGMCMMYTILEILKKTTFFTEMIKTHLKESGNYREVKIPFFSKD
jgi:transcriptional regulator of heat shock response